jgi:hypothetical protein
MLCFIIPSHLYITRIHSAYAYSVAKQYDLLMQSKYTYTGRSAFVPHLQLDLDAVKQLRLLAEVLRALRGARRAVEPERLQAGIAERLGRRGHAVRLAHAVLGPLERRARDLGVREQDGVRRVERDVAVEVVERREEEGRASCVRARVRRVLRGGLAARE